MRSNLIGMTENENTTPDQSTRQSIDHPIDHEEQPAPQPAPKTRWRDRSLGFRGALAVGAAGLILGGLGGTALGFALDGGDDHRGGPGHHGRPFGDDGQRGLVPPGSGQLPPATIPESEASGTAS